MTFYVDNQETAQAIYTANLRLQMRDGWKVNMTFSVKIIWTLCSLLYIF